MNYTNKNEDVILEWLKNHLNEERYEHSLGVADCAKSLALKYGLDAEKAYVAGLLHDCAKCFSFEESQQIAREHLNLDESELTNKKTIHAPVSSYVASIVFGVEDSDILSSIRWHTIGHKNMSVFEKIIYIADKIEYRTREKDYAQPLRNCLEKENGLNLAIYESFKSTIRSLVDRNLIICNKTIDIYNEFLRELNLL